MRAYLKSSKVNETNCARFGVATRKSVQILFALPPKITPIVFLQTRYERGSMDKQEILKEIKRIAGLSNGKVPGVQKFSTLTGIRQSEWYPHLWLRWGDAVKEAGLKENKLNESYSEEHLIKKYIELIRELNRFPIAGDLRVKARADSSFPSHTAFSRIGSKSERAERILNYCKDNNDFQDIVAFCLSIQPTKDDNLIDDSQDQIEIGYVYMIKHGSRNEYKIGKTNNPLRREGEIRIELPEKLNPIHYIETDDPSGIESYWHRRFSKKRKEGEWFVLNSIDVKAFKRWKKIF